VEEARQGPHAVFDRLPLGERRGGEIADEPRGCPQLVRGRHERLGGTRARLREQVHDAHALQGVAQELAPVEVAIEPADRRGRVAQLLEFLLVELLADQHEEVTTAARQQLASSSSIGQSSFELFETDLHRLSRDLRANVPNFRAPSTGRSATTLRFYRSVETRDRRAESLERPLRTRS